ncbi:MAG: hypothetical protein IKT46_00435 [Clostridia bacterium]|nr:hypothetical protein [Clostridia bacterium]
MFGYITPMTEELKVRENELYKSIYCGLCSAMGEHICTSNRLTLSYDIVFLALVRACVTGENISVKKKRCMVHPIIPKNRANIPETLKYCASASALLTYYKVLDDINDKPTLKARLKQPSARRFRKKAGLPSLDRVIATHLAELSSLEKSGGSLDRNADCFGRVLGEVFSYGLDCPELRDMGVHIGRWIYIIDAAEDLEKDRKSGEYNPLSCYDVLPKEAIAVACTLELEAAYNAFNSIEVKNTELKPIINNILTLGMPRAQNKITGDKND